jgi:hypothetical protein
MLDCESRRPRLPDQKKSKEGDNATAHRNAAHAMSARRAHSFVTTGLDPIGAKIRLAERNRFVIPAWDDSRIAAQ